MKNQKGFTLIELAIVIAIITIISVVTIPRLAGYVEVNNERYRANQEQLVNKVLMQYYALTGRYYSAQCDTNDFVIDVSGMYNELNNKAGSVLDSSEGNYRYKVIDGTVDPAADPASNTRLIKKIEAQRVS